MFRLISCWIIQMPISLRKALVWLYWSVHFAHHPLSLSVLILYGQMSPPIVTPRYYVALRQMSGNYLIRANGDQPPHCHKEHFCSVFCCLQGLHGQLRSSSMITIRTCLLLRSSSMITIRKQYNSSKIWRKHLVFHILNVL